MTFEQLRGTIQAHDVRFESCDRDGQEFCDCLERAVDQLEATVATKPFTPDWSLLEATQASLREHMAIAKAAQESERAFREQVAVALEELRGLINLEFIGDEFSDYNEGLRDALRHVDATIAALGLVGYSQSYRQRRLNLLYFRRWI